MDINEYNKKVREAIARDKAVNAVQDTSNLGQYATRTVATAIGKKATVYGR